MNFEIDFVPKIFLKEKTKTRRLVKSEHLVKRYYHSGKTGEVAAIGIKCKTGKIKIKYQVGKSYAVCPGKGKKGVFWCPVCNKLFDVNRKEKITWCDHFVMPLRIKITKIKIERLQDITQKEAKEEGFKSRLDFLIYFYNLYNKRYSEDFPEWNPEVFAFDFEVR